MTLGSLLARLPSPPYRAMHLTEALACITYPRRPAGQAGQFRQRARDARASLRSHSMTLFDAGQTDAWRTARVGDGLGQANVPVAAIAIRAKAVS